ncbi:MAG: glycine zipper 2TM domain-containing protein [Pseudomonadota bacterium]
MRKHLALIALAASLALTSPAWAGHGHDGGKDRVPVFYDYARVTSVKPIWRNRHDAECYERDDHHYRHQHRKRSSSDPTEEMIVGGLLGGLIGNQVADDDNRVPGTVAGAMAGSAIGYAVGHDSDDRGSVRHARYDWDSYKCGSGRHHKPSGYRVTYKYAGKKFRTVLPYHPGKRLELRVKLTPQD